MTDVLPHTPVQGKRITMRDGVLDVPTEPIIPFI